jgi:release factor glutamine methyltransferase
MPVSKSYDQLMAESRLARAEARVLLAHVLQRGKSWLMAHGDEIVPEDVSVRVQDLFLKRRNGEPIAYLLGVKEFYGRSFRVGPGVLIPRPETELLVDWGLEVLHSNSSNRNFTALDLGCGSGCIGLSLALEAEQLGLPLDQITLVDLAPEAITFSQRNALELGVLQLASTGLTVLQGSWFAPFDPSQRFDLIVSNPPYIRLGDPHLVQGDLRFEPAQALSSGESGLQAMAQIIAEAMAFLKPEGRLLLEHGYDQAEALQALLREHGYLNIETRPDLSGHARISAGSKPFE